MNQYSLDEVKTATLKYFREDDLSTNTWISKYALKDKKGNLYEKTPDDMHHRLAKEFARIEAKYPNPLSEDVIYELLKDFKYIIPQGSPMYGIGNDFQLTSISNCFFIGNNDESDSYGSIMRTDEEIAQIYKKRGGCGIDLSHYRPSGAIASGAELKGDAGATLYMDRFSNTTREVAQSGRRGALMESMFIKHPDAEKFIDKKLDLGKVTGANISVKITNEFMEAVKNDGDFYQTFPIDATMLELTGTINYDDPDINEYDVLCKSSGIRFGYYKKIKAKKLWNKLIVNNHKSAEPGILFWDKFVSESTSDGYEDHYIQGVNPCAELPLPNYDSCRLLVINLYSYVINPFTSEAKFNWELFYTHTTYAQRLMDDLIDLELEKLDKIINKIKNDPESDDIKRVELNLWLKIKQKAIEGRRTGLGITAEGDVLAAMGLKYGTKEATEFSVKVHKVLAIYSYKSSIQMAMERGSFPIWDFDKEINNPFIQRVLNYNLDEIEMFQYRKYGRRNIANLTIAPTGCSDKDSILTSKDGFFKLSEVCDENINGFHNLKRDINVLQDKGFTIATRAFNNGVSKTKKILTSSGIEIESTLNHKYKIITKEGDYVWRNVFDLNKGDMLVSRIGGYDKKTNSKLEPIVVQKENKVNSKKIIQPLEVTKDLAKFLGIFYADGSVHKKGLRIHCDYDSEQVTEVIKLAKKVFNINAIPYKERTCESVYLSSNELLIFLKKNSLLKQKAHNIEIPLLVRMSSKESIESFLDGYHMGDGSKTGNTKYIDTVSKKMAQQLAIIMRGIGKNVNIRIDSKRKGSKGKRPIYRIYEKGFGSVDFIKDRYIKKDHKGWLNIIREYGEELFFDEIIDIIDSETKTLDIEVPNGNMYVLNSLISHNTTSLMTQTTSGIEPCFLPVYKRRKKTDNKDKSVFTDETGDMWEEYTVFHHKFIEWYNITYDIGDYLKAKFALENTNQEILDNLVKESPYYKATSNDVDWKESVRMQGGIQKWIDHSISKTINLPKDTTVETVDELYRYAYEVGCKGVTVYRDGSRQGVLITNEEKKEDRENEIVYRSSPKRPKELVCDIYTKIALGKHWTILVGIMKGKPFETFAFEQLSQQEFPKEIKNGVCVRVTRQHYRLIGQRNNKEYIIDNIVNLMSPDEQFQTRDISRSLRFGEHPKYIISDIDKSSFVSSFRKAIGRVLMNYLSKEDVKGEKCPECGDQLIFKEGCVACPSCPYSKCG